jgi:hypothetical protein
LRVKERILRRKGEASNVIYLTTGIPEFTGKDGEKTKTNLHVSAGIRSLDKTGYIEDDNIKMANLRVTLRHGMS